MSPHRSVDLYLSCEIGRRCPAALVRRDAALVPIEASLLDACKADPGELPRHLGADHWPTHRQRYLTLSVVGDHCTRVADNTAWDESLLVPLQRAFTLIRGLVPVLQQAEQAGHVTLMVPVCAAFPEPTDAIDSVLGRSLLGLFESLRAELRHTRTGVSILLADTMETADTLAHRLEDVQRSQPLYAVPAELHTSAIHAYFDPLLQALRSAPAGVPLPAGPQGEVYRAAAQAALRG